MNKYESARKIYEENNRLEIFDKAFENLIDLIKRQTDYDDIKAKEKLIEFDMNSLLVIRDYMGIKTLEKKNKSTNQMVFDEFRTFLTKANLEYEERKKNNERIKQMAKSELDRRKKLGLISEEEEDEV